MAMSLLHVQKFGPNDLAFRLTSALYSEHPISPLLILPRRPTDQAVEIVTAKVLDKVTKYLTWILTKHLTLAWSLTERMQPPPMMTCSVVDLHDPLVVS